MMETLGYGSYLIIDGLGTPNANLDSDEAKAFLQNLANMLEPNVTADFTITPKASADEGCSVLMVLQESHLSLHLFPACQAVSLRLFSRYDVQPEVYARALKESFGINRISSYLSNHSKTLSNDLNRRLRGLLSDRRYTSVRLNNSLLF